MKRFTKLAALAVGLAAIFLSSCANGMVDGTIEGMPKDDSREVTLTVTSDSDLINFDTPVYGNQRSILPTAYTSDDVAFYLCYKNITDASYTATPMEVTFTGDEIPAAGGGADPTVSKKKGTVIINLKQANYDLELFAVKKSVAQVAGGYANESLVKAAACLMATAQADLRYGNAVNFFLTSEGLNKAGSVSLHLYAKGWDPEDYEGYQVTAGLYYTKKTTIGADTFNPGVAVGSSEATLVDISTNANAKISTIIPKDNPPTTANYDKTGIPAGTYLFELRFTKKGKTYYWNDDIKILPDATTEANVMISETIGLAPDKPKSFKAGYIDDLKSEYYSLEFTWDGSDIKNESNFKIELLTVTDKVSKTNTKNPTKDEEWEALAGIDTSADDGIYDTNFVGNPLVYKSGSLGKNNQIATFKAAYGKRYVARICAVNEEGDSDWAYCDIASGITADADAGVAEASGFKSEVINRYKVTYNLSNGELKDKDKADVAKVFGCSQIFSDQTVSNDETPYWTIESGTKKYYTYTGGVAIMQPDGKTDFTYDLKGTATTIEKPTLILNDKQKWTNWTIDGAIYNEIGSAVKPYGGFTNLNLVANYATQATVTLFDDKDYAIASVSSDPAFTGNDDHNHYYMTISQKTTTEAKWTITPPENVVYDYVTVTMYKTSSKNDYYTIPVTYNTTNKKYEATLDIPSYRTGIYDAEICVYSPVREDPYTAQIGVVITD